MDKLILEGILEQNVLNENTSAEVGQYAPLILPLVKKIYPDTLVSQIAAVQPTTSPVAKIASLYAMYTGDASNNENELHIENSRLVSFDETFEASFVEGMSYPSTTGTVKVFYKEISNGLVNLLVRIDAGTLSIGDSINGVSIHYLTANRTSIKRTFSKYSDNIAEASTAREVNFEVRTSTMDTKTRRIKTKFTTEKLQDLQRLYGTSHLDLVAKTVANEIRQEIDLEIIDYLRDIATPMATDIDVTKSLAYGGGDLGGVTFDLYANIYLAGEEIVKATKRNRTFFILADSTTVSFLLINALHSEAKPDESNPYRVGSIGAYPLYCDFYTKDHYMLIGYKFESDEMGDAGLIFSPYTSTITEVDSGRGAFTKNLLTMNRYAYMRHPQDTGTGIGDSDFFRIVQIDYSNLGSKLPNFTDQIRMV